MRRKTTKLKPGRWLKRSVLRKWIKPVAGLVVFFLLMAGLVFWLRSDFWRLKRVDCHLNGQECPPELKAGLMQLFQGKNILFLSSTKVEEEVRRRHTGLNQVQVRKGFPGELLFQLEERKPKAAVVVESALEKKFYLLDEESVLLEETTSAPDLPLIFADHLPELKIGDKLESPSIEKTVSLLVDLQLRLLEPKMAKIISEKEIEIWFKDNLQAIFSSQKNLAIQLDSLQFIFFRTKIEGKQPRHVDLRFDKPVMTYE